MPRTWMRFQSPSLRGSGRFRGASHRPGRRSARVSIPFIAGQWSLPQKEIELRREDEVSIPFIAGQWSLPLSQLLKQLGANLVSIPFIAGQWSLPPEGGGRAVCISEFQSPSLRGSGRFLALAVATAAVWRACFNPLHCGAVVASSPRPASMTALRPCFNPLHCGAVVASCHPRRRAPRGPVCFNPLHCGAVVASGGGL